MPKKRLTVEQFDDVSIVRFVDKRILDEQIIEAISDELVALIDHQNNCKILLDFSNVSYLSGTALGALVKFREKLHAQEGSIAVCNVIPRILELFTVTKYDKTFNLFPDQDAALASLR